MDKKITTLALCIVWFLAACQSTLPWAQPTPNSTVVPMPPSFSAAPSPLVPDFEHVVLVVFENKDFDAVIGNPDMPVFNRLAGDYVLLTQYHAVTHPSLPNYIALIGGDTYGISDNCEDCFINALSLPDYIEASGRTWKTYQEDMPDPCYLGDARRYAQKHNPFVYYDPIRRDAVRCEQSVLPLTALDTDLAAGTLPNFVFITPNLCNDSHDCGLDVSDQWLDGLLAKLFPALDAAGKPYLVVLMFDEAKSSQSCCGLPEEAGGQVAAVLVSPQVKSGFQDDTPYSHYSLLKTIAEAWGLPYLGHAADESTTLMTAPWK